MKFGHNFILIKLFLLNLTCFKLVSAVTMEQFMQSLDMMRNGCAPKVKLTPEQLDNVRIGVFDEGSQDTKITMEQFEQSLDMMRNGCAPKFKVTTEQLDGVRYGKFFDESNQDLKCYMKCIAHLAGTLSKKGELNISKAAAQITIILPVELQDMAKAALTSCKDVQKDYKDSCEKLFQVTKCIRDFSPENFIFP